MATVSTTPASTPKRGENFWLWLLKIVSGLLVIVLLGVHLTVNHITPTEGLMTYQDVVAYLSNPWIALMEISFLIIVVSHALIGARSIVLDFNPSRGVLRFVNWLFLGIGVVSIVYGIWLVWVIVT